MILIWFLAQRKNYGYSLYISLLLITCFYILTHFSTYYTAGNEYFYTLAILSLASYSLYWLKNIRTVEIIIIFFVVVFVFQLYTGAYQLYNSESPFAISGTLQNSGVFAYYLVCNLPIVYWFSFSFCNRLFYSIRARYLTWVFRVVFSLISILVFCFTYYTQSRTAIIAFWIGIICLVVHNYKINIIATLKLIPNVFLLITGLFSSTVIIWFGVWLYNFKKLSAVGRIFGINVSLDNSRDHLWLGTGIGRFTWYYPQWQSSYFEKHPTPKLEFFFCADESYIIFNEILQLFSTLGILGFSLCVYGIYVFFKLKSERNNSLLPIVKYTVLLIISCGFTSYPLHVNLLLLLLGTCIAAGFIIANTSNDILIIKTSGYKNIFDKSLISLGIILLSLSSYNGYKAYIAAQQWNDIRNNLYNERHRLEICEKIYPILNTDGKFLIQYGSLLNKDANNGLNAISVLERARERIITREGTEALVKAYRNRKNYDTAIKHQNFLVNYIPNKFQLRYDLLQLYITQNDTLYVRKTCQSILQMPVKVESYEVAKIKKETNEIFKRYQ